MIQNGTTYVQLSEQEGVDCATEALGYGRNNGCDGGTAYYYWMYTNRNGAESALAYPYNFVQGTCNQSRDRVVVSEANTYTYDNN